MGRLFTKFADATEYPPEAGDTLKKIVETKCDEAEPKITIDEVTLFNWGTKDPAEVARCLVELVGVRTWAGDDPTTWELDPARGYGKSLRLPKVFKAENLAYDKNHTLKVRQQLPATAVAITKLDKWFLPGEETCDVSWKVEGVFARASKLDFDVYASNNCKATPTKADEFTDFTFADMPDIPIRQRSVSESAEERSKGDIKDWKGESEAADGILKPVAPDPKFINAALSPYTVLMRYYEDDKHKKAILRVQSFWPTWKGIGAARAVVDESLKIKWYLKDCPAALQGQFLVYDKDDTIVWRQAIPEGKCADGDQEIDWAVDGKTVVVEDKMPYRVQIQVHSNKDTAKGFALAGMHTEVRIFVDKETHELELDPYVAKTDKASLDLSIADWYHKQVDPVKGDGKLWTKFALANAGFHPGPINDGATNAHFESALNEFQRSVPKHPGKPGEYRRLAITAGGDDNAETKDALENLSGKRRRAVFGKPNDRSDWADTVDAKGKVTAAIKDDDAFKAALRDPDGRMIVWVDDRNWYTDFPWIDSSDNVTPKLRTTLTSDPVALGNKRGGYTDGDARVDYDALEVARPWIPLQADFRLLRKANALTDVVAAETDKVKAAAMRKLIGPLRVDWSFDEIEATEAVSLTIAGATANHDLPKLDPEVDAVLGGLYHRQRTRTRVALRFALDGMKATHPRLDIHKQSKYYNAPESCGGIRPPTPATYFKQPFGTDVESLRPWRAKDSPIETVYTVVHDALGQDADDFFEKRQGRSGIYFHPSRIAGDGYQVRAQVRFDKTPDWQFPNADALKVRYPRLAQAQSVKFRNWRRTTIRGFIAWGPTNAWAAGGGPPRPNLPAKGPDGFRQYYTSCHVHVANELGMANGELDYAPASLFDVGEYRDMVKTILTDDDPRRGKWWNLRSRWINVVNTAFWPWSEHKQYGIVEASTANVKQSDGYKELDTKVISELYWKYTSRVTLEIVRQIEKRKGLMRGHVVVEYQLTPDAYHRRYQCKRCLDVFTFMQNAPGTILKDEDCPTPGCGDKFFFAGKLRPVPKYEGWYECNADATHEFGPATEDSASGPGVWGGAACPTCGDTIDLSEMDAELYKCNKCDFEGWYNEPGAPAARGSHQNQSCPCLCGGQLKSKGEPLAVKPMIIIKDSEDAKKLAFSSGGIPLVGLGSSSLGEPIGVALNFLGDTDLWAHELAHNRYYQHTGNAGSSGGPPEHDTVHNSTVNWAHASIKEKDPVNRMWDRACLMTYATDLVNYDVAKDMPCFCFRCVLKNRGWRVNAGNLPAIAGTIQDP